MKFASFLFANRSRGVIQERVCHEILPTSPDMMSQANIVLGTKNNWHDT